MKHVFATHLLSRNHSFINKSSAVTIEYLQ